MIQFPFSLTSTTARIRQPETGRYSMKEPLSSEAFSLVRQLVDAGYVHCRLLQFFACSDFCFQFSHK